MSQSAPETATTPPRTALGLVDANWLDFALAHVSPMLSVQRIKARVVSMHPETHDIMRVELRPNRLFRGFEPGQAIPFRVRIGGIDHERYYSLTSAPGERTLSIAIKKQSGGVVSGYVHERLKVGDVVELGQAVGEFVLPDAAPRNLLLVAGGSGITPMVSLIRAALADPAVSRITLMYYAREDADFAFRRQFRELASASGEDRFTLLEIPEVPAESGPHGRFSPEHLEDALRGQLPDRVYLCGPGGMVEAVTAELDRRGLSDRLVCEYFALPSADAEPDAEAEISFRKSGVTALSRKASILEAAEEAGLKLRHGCRIGICHTCTCTKVEGAVRNRVTGAVEDRPNAPIRLCVSQPLGTVVIDA